MRFLSQPEEGLAPSLELAGLLYLPDRPDGRPAPGLVVGHGAGSRAGRHVDFCIAAREQGFVVLALDLRGHGDSQGRGDGPLELDLAAAARFLRDRTEADPRRICYRGSSMGGFYGLKAAPDAGFAALVLICPADEQVMLRVFGGTPDPADRDESPDAARDREPAPARWDRPRMREYFKGQDSRALAGSVGCPVLLVHARSDDQVPLTHSLTLAAHLPTETMLVALEGGSHSSAQHDPAVHALSLAWLTTQLEKRRNAEAAHISGR